MEPSNLLIIMSDEHDPRHMGCSGNPRIRTPNLDALAALGVRFSRAYTNCPICVPARASFATGRYVHEIGYWDNAMGWDGRVPGWPHRLQAEGLRNETIGKLHYRSADDPLGIDRQIEPMHLMDGVGQVWGSVRNPMPACRKNMEMIKAVGPGVSDYNAYDMRIAGHACDWLRAAPRDGRPWLLYVGFVAPHFPLVAPEEFFETYPLDTIEQPKLHPVDGYRRHPWVQRMVDFVDHDARFDENGRRRAVQAYLALVSFLDAQVGRILATLDAEGLRDTTRVVYTSDHGDNVGSRGLWGKSVLYEESTRIPLIAAGPDLPTGSVCGTPASLVDLYPTVLDGFDLAPTEAERALPGRSLFELAGALDDPERPVFSEYHAAAAPTGAFMIRRGRYKFHYYVDYPSELFDLEADPEETIDLAADPAHAGIVAACEASLRAICDPEEVDRRAKADQDALVARFGGPEAAFATGTPAATPVPGATQD